MPTPSGFYKNTVVGALRAPGQIIQWEPSAPNPSGFRIHESGFYRVLAKSQVPDQPHWRGGFQAQKESGCAIDFGTRPYIRGNAFQTSTICLSFNLGEVNWNPASFFDQLAAQNNVSEDFQAFNMRFWLGSIAAFAGKPLPTFYFRPSAKWLGEYELSPTDPSVSVVPSSMPALPNVYAKLNNVPMISGGFQENEFSHYLYIKGYFPPSNYHMGRYGGFDKKDFTLRFTYDYTDLLAKLSWPWDFYDYAAYIPGSGPPSTLMEYVSGVFHLDEHSPRRMPKVCHSGFHPPQYTFAATDMTLWEYVTNTKTPGGVAWASGKFGDCAEFNGTNNYLRNDSQGNRNFHFPDDYLPGKANQKNSSFTFSCWTRLDKLTGGEKGRMGIISSWYFPYGDSYGQYKLFYEPASGCFAVTMQSRFSNYYSLLGDRQHAKYHGKLQTNTWYFVAFGYNHKTNEMFLRVNDNPTNYLQQMGGCSGMGTSCYYFGIGLEGYTWPNTPRGIGLLDGRVDEVNMWRGKALSDYEMVQLYKRGAGQTYPFNPLVYDFSQGGVSPYTVKDAGIMKSLIAHWSFNRPSGSTRWPDDAGGKDLVWQQPWAGKGSPGASSGIINNERGVSQSGCLVLGRDMPYGSGYLQYGAMGSNKNFMTSNLRYRIRCPFAVAVWVQIRNTTKNHAICGNWSINDKDWKIYYQASDKKFYAAVGASIYSDLVPQNGEVGDIEANKWYLLILNLNTKWRDQNNKYFCYLDFHVFRPDGQHFKNSMDTIRGGSTYTFNIPFTVGLFEIGRTVTDVNRVYADIKIDALTIWQKFLSDKEITQYYNNGKGLEWSAMTYTEREMI